MSILRDRSLAGLLCAELVSLTGSAMTFVALPWFVVVTTGSAAKMGWVLAARWRRWRSSASPPAP